MKVPTLVRCAREQAKLGKLILDASVARDTGQITTPEQALDWKAKVNAGTSALLECRRKHQEPRR